MAKNYCLFDLNGSTELDIGTVISLISVFNIIIIITEKIFLMKLKGHANLFITGEFLYNQYRMKEENTKGTEDLFLYRRFFVRSVFVRTIFDCILSLTFLLSLLFFLFKLPVLLYYHQQYYRDL